MDLDYNETDRQLLVLTRQHSMLKKKKKKKGILIRMWPQINIDYYYYSFFKLIA